MSLSMHIFGSVLLRAPFLSWMKAYPGALRKVALRTLSQFRDCNDMLFSYGEVVTTVYVLVNGWVTLSLGSTFEEEHIDFEASLKETGTLDVSVAVARRMCTETFGAEAAKLDQHAQVLSGQVVFNNVHEDYA